MLIVFAPHFRKFTTVLMFNTECKPAEIMAVNRPSKGRISLSPQQVKIEKGLA